MHLPYAKSQVLTPPAQETNYPQPVQLMPRPQRSHEALSMPGAGSVGPHPVTIFVLVHTGSGSSLQCRCLFCRKNDVDMTVLARLGGGCSPQIG